MCCFENGSISPLKVSVGQGFMTAKHFVTLLINVANFEHMELVIMSKTNAACHSRIDQDGVSKVTTPGMESIVA